MDAVTGALIAGVVAWISILLAVRLPTPRRRLGPRGVRRLGGATIALMALQILGVPLPPWLPVAAFAAGLVVLYAVAPRAEPS